MCALWGVQGETLGGLGADPQDTQGQGWVPLVGSKGKALVGSSRMLVAPLRGETEKK